MEVQNVYQDSEGKWHIDYDISHLIGLAIRTYFGQFLLGLFISIPFLVISILSGVVVGMTISRDSTVQKLHPQHQDFCADEQERQQLNHKPKFQNLAE
jgi:hypothetical protein